MCLGIIYKVPDYKIIVRITHTVYDIELISGTLIVDILILRLALDIKSLLKTFLRQMIKIGLVIFISVRYLIFRKMYRIEVILSLTHGSDLLGVIHCFRKT